MVVVASNAGDPRTPQWYRNVLADATVYVQIGPTRGTRIARTAVGDEAVSLRSEFDRVNPRMKRYARRTSRDFPVVVLEDRTPCEPP